MRMKPKISRYHGYEELIQGGGNCPEAGLPMGPIVIVVDNEQQIVAESEEEAQESMRREINEALNAQIEDVNVMDLDI